jgi:hypothetical protein
MPRDGSGVYTQPSPDVITATSISSTVYNGFVHDIATDANAPRPIVAGGTGAASAAAARTALAVETFGQVVTNYDSHSFLPGSFYSDSAATSPPVVGHAFVGLCAFVDANNMYLEAYDRDDAAQPGALWIRQKKAGTWSSWVKAQALNVNGTPSANQFTTWQSSTAIQGVTITGLVKGNGASAPTAAVANTDYLPVNNPGITGNPTAPTPSVDDNDTSIATTAFVIGQAGSTSPIMDGSATAGASLRWSRQDHVHPNDTSRLALAGNQTVTGGFRITPSSQGTISSGTFTPDAFNHNYQFYTNNGAHTLAAPANDCAIDILITNGASAGAITFSGFTVGANTGDPLTTINTNKFVVSIRRINGVSTYAVKALQ